jgi:hypothetical protein
MEQIVLMNGGWNRNNLQDVVTDKENEHVEV